MQSAEKDKLPNKCDNMASISRASGSSCSMLKWFTGYYSQNENKNDPHNYDYPSKVKV